MSSREASRSLVKLTSTRPGKIRLSRKALIDPPGAACRRLKAVRAKEEPAPMARGAGPMLAVEATEAIGTVVETAKTSRAATTAAPRRATNAPPSRATSAEVSSAARGGRPSRPAAKRS